MQKIAPIHRIEPLESRIQLSGGLSGAADLTHSTGQLPQSRISLSGASAAGSSFFAGGYDFPLSNVNIGRTQLFDTLDEFSPGSQQPITTKLSQARSQIAGAGTGGKVIFAGGNPFAGGNSVAGPSKVVDIIDVASGITSTHLLSRGRTSGVAVGTGNTIIVAGGTEKPDRTVDVWNIASNRWSTSRMPHALSKAYNIGGPDIGAAAVGTKLIFSDGKLAEIYDTLTGHWTTAIMRNPTTRPIGASIGGLAIFVGADGQVNMYNDVTGAWTTQTVPQKLYGLAATSVGTKAIFAGGSPSDASGPQGSSTVNVFDAVTGQWSQTSLSVGRDFLAGTSSSGRAIFAGGSTHQPGSVPNPVDIFTDNSPTAVLSGGISGSFGQRDKLIVSNTGDADLTGPYTVQLYASRDHTLNGAILVGSLNVTTPLAAGTSSPFSVRSIVPSSAPAGSYHLLAAVQDAAGKITPITANSAMFRMPKTSARTGLSKIKSS